MELKALYEVKAVHKGNSHFYGADGQTYPGTTGYTGIIGGNKTRMLMGWAVKVALTSVRSWALAFGAAPALLEPDAVEAMLKEAKAAPNKKKDDAADKGKLFHSYIEAFYKTGVKNPDPEFLECLEKLEFALYEMGIKVIATETPVVSKKYNVGGAIDAVGERSGAIIILDWKFAGGIYEEYALQVGGSYVQCFRETYGVEPAAAVIFRYDLVGKFWEIKWVRDLNLALTTFLNCKDLKENLNHKFYV